MKNEKDRTVETNVVDKREREEEDEEERKIDKFFKLIKTYQEARKRRREELTENSRKKWNGGERSCVVVPEFIPEDFSQCRMDLKPVMVVAEHKEDDDAKVKEEEEEEEEVEKVGQEEKGLDLNLAL